MFVISKSFSNELKIKSSIFKSFIYHVESIQHIRECVKLLENKFPDASHICYAYRLLELGNNDLFGNPHVLEYSCDDGEPAGTAGKQILNILKSNKLIFTIICVVRYFGGTKLGIPGLINAYKDSSLQVINLTDKKKWVLYNTIELLYEYSFHKTVDVLIRKYKGIVKSNNFSDNIYMKVKIPSDSYEEIKIELKEKSKGTISIKS